MVEKTSISGKTVVEKRSMNGENVIIDKTSSNYKTRRITSLAILGALGALLMTFIQVPYPPVGFLKIEFSDIVVLLAFFMFGWKDAVLVGIFKTLINLIVLGPVMGPIPIPIGQISAFISSMAYVGGLYLSVRLGIFNKRWLASGLTIGIVVFVMVVANYLFVTPIYMGSWTFLGVREWLTLSTFGLEGNTGYLLTILIVYVPFNLIKGIAVMSTFFVVYKALKAYLAYQS